MDTTNLERLDMRPEGNIKVVDILMQAGNVVFDYLLSDSKGRSGKLGGGRPNGGGMMLQRVVHIDQRV